MDYSGHKDYYKTAYQNGADIWTHVPVKMRGIKKLAEKLPPGGSVLDLGSGRGLIAKNLAEMGFKTIGLDFEEEIVEKANSEVENWGLAGKLKFIKADVFSIPFADKSFDGVCDIGLLENLHKEDWSLYVNEIDRILKPGGFYLNVSLSRKTKTFLDFSPINSTDGELNKDGMHYHFFEKEEMEKIFAEKMIPVSSTVEFVEKPREISLLHTLFEKRKVAK